MAKIITIIGSPASGKSVLACGIAQALSKQKKEVLLINNTTTIPMHPVWQPFKAVKRDKSLENILSSTVITDDVDSSTVCQCIELADDNHYLALLGYTMGTDPLLFTDISVNNSIQLIKSSMEIVEDYIIIDCTSEVSDIFRPIAIKMADVVFDVITTDLRGLYYYNGQVPLLSSNESFHFDNHVHLAGQTKPNHPFNEINKQINHGFYGVLEYDKNIERSCLDGNIFHACENTSKAYRQTLKSILGVIYNGT